MDVNIWLLLLTLLNVILLAGLSFTLFLKLKEKKEDQRLTKGLQLLQNKISILQDLSDKTDEQVHKLVHLVDQKAGEVRGHINEADHRIEQIEKALSKALDVSKIFSEQIPQQEMANRQKTSLYVQAAKLANQGFSPEQISQKIDLSPAEIEMIAKVNKDNLQFAEESLPDWVNLNANQIAQNTSDQEIADFTAALSTQNQKMQQSVASSAFDSLQQDLTAQNSLRNEFEKTIKTMPQNFNEYSAPANVDKKAIRPFEFKRISTVK